MSNVSRRWRIGFFQHRLRRVSSFESCDRDAVRKILHAAILVANCAEQITSLQESTAPTTKKI